MNTKLGELVRFKGGSAFPQDQQGNANGVVPFMKVSDLARDTGAWLAGSPANWLTDNQVSVLRPVIVPPHATVFAKIGEGLKRERCRIVNRPTAIDNNMMAAIPSEKIHSFYLYYLMKTIGLGKYAVGSALPYLKQGTLSDIEVTVPPLDYQHAIAEVLGALDDKIASNTKAARTFKKLAQAEFQQLLATATTQVPLREVLRLEYGKSLAATRRVHGEVDVFGSGGIVGTHNESLLPGPGVIVGRKGTAGSVHWAPREYFPIDTTFYAVPVNQDASLVFCLHLLKSLRLNEMNSDSAVPGLNREEALAALVPMPVGSKMRLFTTSGERLFALVDQADRESRTLTQIRDVLLPKLMSGKLSVTEVETAVSAAV